MTWLCVPSESQTFARKVGRKRLITMSWIVLSNAALQYRLLFCPTALLYKVYKPTEGNITQQGEQLHFEKIH